MQTTGHHHSPEVRDRAVRMVREHRNAHSSEWATIGRLEKLGHFAGIPLARRLTA